MAAVRIFLPDGSVKEFDRMPTVLGVAEALGPRLAQETLGARLNDSSEIVDLRTELPDGTRLKIITSRDPEGLEVIRHSAAHVLAQAVQELWPQVKVTIGPVIDEGFFYDFDSPHAFSADDLGKIEARMQEILKRDLPVVREVWSQEKAIETFRSMGERFKVEIIQDLGASEVSVYRQGDWFDLCRGPHVQRLGQIKAIKVLHQAGAYWRGDEKNAQLQRIYATAFFSSRDLNEYLKNLEEAKRRDHRKLGRDLDLFYFHDLAPGSPFFTANGTVIYSELQNFVREKYQSFGYREVISPQVFDVDLYHRSGHFENYRENMYFMNFEDRDFSLKPMNCPGHCLLYGSDRKSYRDLPWRVADFGRLHRYERSGSMHGLARVRSFCQDDAHIFCAMEQIQREIESFMTMLGEIYRQLGMGNYHIYFSTRPEKRMGADAIWDAAEAALETALKVLQLPYRVNPGDGAFYGPKLDVMFVDALKRPWQLGTIQCDFNMPEAFDLKYIGADNKEHRPVMLHRAILGSLERFIAVYLEHTAGHLPLWLSPVQVRVLNVTDKQEAYAREVANRLQQAGLRVVCDDRGEKLGYKIREAQLQKTPYMAIVGEKEWNDRAVSVRLRSGQNIEGVPLDAFVAQVQKEAKERLLTSSFQPDSPNHEVATDHKALG